MVHITEDPLSINFGLTSALRADLPSDVILGYQFLFLIPDRDYQTIYQNSASDGAEKSIFGGSSVIIFVGRRRVLLQAQMGLGEAQSYVAGGITYRLTTTKNRRKSANH